MRLPQLRRLCFGVFKLQYLAEQLGLRRHNTSKSGEAAASRASNGGRMGCDMLERMRAAPQCDWRYNINDHRRLTVRRTLRCQIMSGGTIQGMIVQPYIGERYGKEKPFGPSVLVLGESSYTDTLPVRAPLPSDWNRRIIACVKDRQQDPTITRAVGVFYGGFRDFDQRWEFWQTATFANFVQNNIGRSRKRPTDEDWQGGAACFQEYLD